MRHAAGPATVLRMAPRNKDAPAAEVEAPPVVSPETPLETYMERALQSRIEDLPSLLRTFERRASVEPGNTDLSEAIIHLGELTRALAPSRAAPEEVPRLHGKANLVLVAAAAMLVAAGGAFAPRILPAVAAEAPAPTPSAPAQAAPASAPDIELSRGETVAANALRMLARFPQGAPARAASGSCADSNAVMVSSRALAKRLAEPLLGPGEAGTGAAESNASDWNALIFIARLLQRAERAQIGARGAGCITGSSGPA